MKTEMRKIKSSDLKGKTIAIGQVNVPSIITFHRLKKDNVNVGMFFDKDYRIQQIKYNDIPVFPWSNFYAAYVILTVSSRYEELTQMLIETCGYDEEHIIYVEEIDFECDESDVINDVDLNWIINNTVNPFQSYFVYKTKLFKSNYSGNNVFAPIIALDINNKCTLNCRYCYAQMPYYNNNEKRNFDINRIIKNLDVFLDKVDYIPYLDIIGGEPLLHPDLDVLINYLNSEKAQRKIVCAQILTNGTLLLSEKQINALKANPIFWRVSVSPYGEHSKKQYELFSQLHDEGIQYFSRYMVYWQKFGVVTTPDSFKEDDIRKKCEKCACGNLHLSEDYIFRCPVIRHFVLLNKIPYDQRNAFDCTKDYTREEIIAYYQGVCPGMAYCNGNHQVYIKPENADEFAGEYVPVAEQADGVIPYKRYE